MCGVRNAALFGPGQRGVVVPRIGAGAVVRGRIQAAQAPHFVATRGVATARLARLLFRFQRFAERPQLASHLLAAFEAVPFELLLRCHCRLRNSAIDSLGQTISVTENDTA